MPESHFIPGIKAGPGFHARYFQLKNYDKHAREEYVEKRRGAYTAFVLSKFPHARLLTTSPSFGATALALNLVPVVGLLFNITSTIGAALWASNMEKTRASSYGTGRNVDQPGQSAGDMGTKDEVKVAL